MKIPVEDLPSTIQALRNLVDERTSAPWAAYSEEDISTDDQDLEDAEKVKTVQDVYNWLRDQGSRTCFVEYASCLDPLNEFKIEGKEEPDETDEKTFLKYLRDKYNLSL